VIDEYALILVLFAIYLSECIFFPSRDASLFKRSILGYWKVAKSSLTSRFRLVVENLLPRLGGTLLAESAPPLISPLGICCSQRGMGTRLAYCIDLADAGPFTYKDCDVLCGSRFVCSSVSAEQAVRLAELLTQVKASTIAERDSLITHAFHQLLDTRRAARRWKAYKKASKLLSFDTWALFGVLVALSVTLGPLRFQFAAAWPLALVTLVSLPHTAYLFYRIHLIFFRDKAQARWKQVALMFLTPTAAIRAGDLISREIFSGFHSLAVARVVLSEPESRAFTANTLREMSHPVDSNDEEGVSQVAKWARHRWASVVWAWTEKEFGDPRTLIQAPRKERASCVCYCPRCLAQYVVSRNYCADCPGVATQAF
jgi:hypothetical protein